ncbi:MAG TPA: hypothetical protein DEQ06_01605 [Porphyromonadaceae bacterium]|nr:hypothetical protein [Porphyromonadaceae bacterium]
MKIILFDGVCNFCNATVNFILKKDKQQIFRCAAPRESPGATLPMALTNNNPAKMILVASPMSYS